MNPFGTAIDCSAGMRQPANLLTVGQVAVYPVDARGLPAGGMYGHLIAGMLSAGLNKGAYVVAADISGNQDAVAKELGAADFLSKPIDFELLKERLRQLPDAAA